MHASISSQPHGSWLSGKRACGCPSYSLSVIRAVAALRPTKQHATLARLLPHGPPPEKGGQELDELHGILSTIKSARDTEATEVLLLLDKMAKCSRLAKEHGLDLYSDEILKSSANTVVRILDAMGKIGVYDLELLPELESVAERQLSKMSLAQHARLATAFAALGHNTTRGFMDTFYRSSTNAWLDSFESAFHSLFQDLDPHGLALTVKARMDLNNKRCSGELAHALDEYFSGLVASEDLLREVWASDLVLFVTAFATLKVPVPKRTVAKLWELACGERDSTEASRRPRSAHSQGRGWRSLSRDGRTVASPPEFGGGTTEETKNLEEGPQKCQRDGLPVASLPEVGGGTTEVPKGQSTLTIVQPPSPPLPAHPPYFIWIVTSSTTTHPNPFTSVGTEDIGEAIEEWEDSSGSGLAASPVQSLAACAHLHVKPYEDWLRTFRKRMLIQLNMSLDKEDVQLLVWAMAKLKEVPDSQTTSLVLQVWY
eukprot:gene10159-8063_t